jgi:cell division initiation protein
MGAYPAPQPVAVRSEVSDNVRVFMTPPEIEHQTLKAGRGYDRTDVDRLLEHVASSYEQVWLERDELRSRLTELEGELAAFRESERYLRATLVTAQRAADELRSRAEQDAERLRAEGLAELERARAGAERELEALGAEIEHARTLERRLRSNLRAFLEQALSQVDNGGVQAPAVETLADALSLETRTADRHDG